jgi:hypothetical protein
MPSIHVERVQNSRNSANMEQRDSRVLNVLHEEDENSSSAPEDTEGYDEVDAGLGNRSNLRREILGEPCVKKTNTKLTTSSRKDTEYEEVDAGLRNRSELRRENLKESYVKKTKAKNEKKRQKRSESVPTVPERLLKLIPGNIAGKQKRSHSEPAIQTRWYVSDDEKSDGQTDSGMTQADSDVIQSDNDVKFNLEGDSDISVRL